MNPEHGDPSAREAPAPRGRSDDIEDAIAGYIDRLQAGEKIDPAAVLAEHPEIGAEVLDSLEDFPSSSSDRPIEQSPPPRKRPPNRTGRATAFPSSSWKESTGSFEEMGQGSGMDVSGSGLRSGTAHRSRSSD